MKKISIICPFRNEIEVLEETLKSFVNQTYPNKEVILLDSDSSDGSTEVAKLYAQKHAFIKYYNSPPKKGRWATDFYIEAMRYTTGYVIYAADANGKLEAEYLEKTVKPLGDKVAGAVGFVKIWPDKSALSRFRSVIWELRYRDTARMQREINEGRILPRTFLRSAYDAVGGFDKSAGWVVDTYFNKKLLAAGYKITYVPEALWWHKWRDSVGKLIRYSYKFGTLNYGLAKTDRKQVIKIVYFLSVFPFIIAGFFEPLFFVYILAHPLPLIVKYLRIFFKAKSLAHRGYVIIGPVVSYLQNVPYALGFVRGCFVQQ